MPDMNANSERTVTYAKSFVPNGEIYLFSGTEGATVYRGLESTMKSSFFDRWYGKYLLEKESFPSVEEAELHLLSQGTFPPEPRSTRPDLRSFRYTGKFEEKTKWRR